MHGADEAGLHSGSVAERGSLLLEFALAFVAVSGASVAFEPCGSHTDGYQRWAFGRL